MWPHTARPDYDKAEYVKAEIEKMREFAFKEIDEAMSINNRVFKNICLFSLNTSVRITTGYTRSPFLLNCFFRSY